MSNTPNQMGFLENITDMMMRTKIPQALLSEYQSNVQPTPQQILDRRKVIDSIDPNTPVLGDLPYSPSSAGMVMNPKNAKKIYQTVNQALGSYSPELLKKYPNMIAAAEYARAKYPKLFGQLSGFSNIPSNVAKQMSEGELYGAYNPFSRVLGFVESNAGRAANSVNTFTHELVHALQHNRKFKGDAAAFQKKYDEFNDMFGYEWNPMEVLAERGGKTGANTYKNFEWIVKNLLGK